MSGTFQDFNEPDRAVTEAAVQAGLASSAARVAERQAESHAFIVDSGHETVGGHHDVGTVPPFLAG